MSALPVTAEIAGDALQRARGRGHLTTQVRDGRTAIKTLFQEGCAKISVPHTHDQSLQAVLMNTAGGLCGGDEIGWEARATAGSRLVLTMPACERVYRSLGGAARIATRLSAGAGSRLDWLPQETILYEGARLERSIDIDLDAGATLLAVEAVLLGREAMGESARNAHFRDSWQVRRNGRLVHAEATRLGGDPLGRDGISLLDGANAFATVLYIGDDAEGRIDEVRNLLSQRSAASATGGRLTVRAIANSGMALRAIIAPVVQALSGAGALPRLWTI